MADPASDVRVAGISLAQYAAVMAARAEGFPIGDVLQIEGITPGVWSKADPSWKLRLVDDPAVFARYQGELSLAEDWLDREVKPIRDDLGAWLAFLDAYAAHPSPATFLRGSRLGTNDLARLQRFWDQRAREDASVASRVAQMRKGPLDPLPELVVGAAVLRRSRGAAPAEPSLPPAPTVQRHAIPADTSLAPGKLRLYAYVALKARLAESPTRAASVLAELGITNFAAVDAEWEVILREDAALARDYRRLLEAQRAKIRSTEKGSSSAFAARSEAPLAAGGSPLPQAVPGTPVLPKPTEDLRGTSLALPVPTGPALPFKGTATPTAPPPRPPFEQPPARRALGTTSPVVDVPNKADLPFAPAGAAAVPAVTLEQHASLSSEIAGAPERAMETIGRSRLTPAQKVAADRHYAERFAGDPALRERWERAYIEHFERTRLDSGRRPPRADPVVKRDLGGTSLALSTPSGPVLPFVRGAAPAPGSAAPPPRPLDAVPAPRPLAETSLALDVPNTAVLPFAPASAAPPLTLAQYAAFRARLTLAGEDDARTWAEFGVASKAAKEALQAQFASLFRRDPDAQGRFIGLLQRLVTELRGRSGGS